MYMRMISPVTCLRRKEKRQCVSSKSYSIVVRCNMLVKSETVVTKSILIHPILGIATLSLMTVTRTYSDPAEFEFGY